MLVLGYLRCETAVAGAGFCPARNARKPKATSRRLLSRPRSVGKTDEIPHESFEGDEQFRICADSSFCDLSGDSPPATVSSPHLLTLQNYFQRLTTQIFRPLDLVFPLTSSNPASIADHQRVSSVVLAPFLTQLSSIFRVPVLRR
jgi:hypothetical protein